MSASPLAGSTSNFAFKYLTNIENFRETVFACSYGTQAEGFFTKWRSRKSFDTVPLIKVEIIRQFTTELLHNSTNQ